MKKFDWYSDDLMYDVVATVLKLQGTIKIYRTYDILGDANYYQIYNELSKTRCAPVEKVVKYLRLAEQCGYIRGSGGFWNRGRGGSKKWHFVKWPPYPYYELMGGNNGE